MGLGYVFSDAITLIAERAARLGRLLAVVVAGALAGYVLVKYVRRRLFLRALRMARISPETLKERLDAGEGITIVDLRTRLDVAAMPYAIPGSRWFEASALDDHVPDILRARELVLYCS